MNENIKEVMRLSFHDSFFVNKKTKDNNYTYLDALVDTVLEKEKIEDYEGIANRVWMLDSRIKNIFSFNMEFVSDFFENVELDDSVVSHFINVPDLDSIKKIARQSKNVSEFLQKLNKALLFYNWDNLDISQKNIYVDNILCSIAEKYNVSINVNSNYSAKKITDNIRINIVLNEIICWLANQLGFRFSYQTLDALEMLEEYEKTEMYFHIGKDLVEKKQIIQCDEEFNKILWNIVKPFTAKYSGDFDDYLIELSENELELANMYIYIQDEFCRYIKETLQEKLCLYNRIRLIEDSDERKQATIDELNRKIIVLQHQIEKIIQDNNKNADLSQKKIESMKAELYSLREYVFDNNQLDNGTYFEESQEHIRVDDYCNVAIIGGHIQWQKKVIEQFPGVHVISTDQNIIDWSFFNQIKIVVIVTNYISHSMYYRVMDNVKNQKILFINHKNIDQIKRKIDYNLLNIENRQA